MTYDLHIHSCLSPCASDDMTPTTIAGFAALGGIDLIAITDHNAADNLPAAAAACREYGVRLLPGIEVNTAEEIHLLCYLPTVEAALALSDALYARLPALPYDPQIWGRQIIMDEHDNILRQKDKLLAGAVEMDIYEVAAMCRGLGGVPVPAHVDKDSYSLLSVLGFAPQDLPFEAYELRRPEHTLAKLQASGRLPQNVEILSSSDAHQLADIAEWPRTLADSSALMRLIEGC